MCTGDLLEAWRDATRATELAERLAAAAVEAADLAETSATASEDIAALADTATQAAERAADSARAAATRARALASHARELDLTTANEAVASARAAEQMAHDRYRRAFSDAQNRHATSGAAGTHG